MKQSAAAEFMRLGLVDPAKVEYGKAQRIKKLMPGANKLGALMQEDPLKAADALMEAMRKPLKGKPIDTNNADKVREELAKVKEAQMSETAGQALQRLGFAADSAAGRMNLFNPQSSPVPTPNSGTSKTGKPLDLKRKWFFPSNATGGRVLSDGFVQVHSGEEIIPARVTRKFSAMISRQQSTSKQITLNYSPVIHASPDTNTAAIEKVLDQHAGNLVRMVQEALEVEDRDTQLAV
jgi:hypothetical protein